MVTGMTPNANWSHPPAAGDGGPILSDIEVLGFVAEMTAVQLDQLAALLADWGEPAGSAAGRAREMVSRWRGARYAESATLTIGEPWVWAIRKGLDACGLRTRLVKPREPGLRHAHAVTDVRLAVERTSAFRQGGASWRAERRIMSGLGFPARSEHIPDGEVHWPADGGSPWAGGTWAIEVELSRKTVERTAEIMAEVLSRTADYDCPPAAATGLPPRYARLVYICSRTSVRTVLAARAELGAPLSARIDVYDLPESATRLNTPKRGWEP
jgi:hypothetical protein